MTALTESVSVISAHKEEQSSRKKSLNVQKIISGMPEGGKVTFGHKFALAVGAGPITLPLVTTTVYIQMFLLDVARVLPMYATSIIVTARILDAVTGECLRSSWNLSQYSEALTLFCSRSNSWCSCQQNSRERWIPT